jgi:asparagine synthase (glutamine-hydrolysing)
LYRHVPRELIERPKMGFGIPLAAWLRGPLRDWAESLIAEPRLIPEGYFHPAPIRQSWNALLQGDSRQQFKVWAVLMFQSWLDAEGQSSGKPDVPVALAG